METSEYKEKVAFITGGARGFGKAFAEALATRGAKLVLADIDTATLEATAKEFRTQGYEVLPVTCDVSNQTQVEKSIAATVKTYGAIDILINNAGLHSDAYNKPMGELGMSKLKPLFDVNLMGVIACSLAAKDVMSGRDGVILNISSSAAYGCQTAYGVSKLAVRGLTVTLAHEFKHQGIRVNAIAPGLIFTDTIRAELPQSVVDTVKQQQILERDGEERDVVEAMLYLTSEKSRFITGETLRVSGGFTLQV